MPFDLPSQQRQQLLSIFKLGHVPRIHVLSDLHLEYGPYELPAGLDFDILVAAGDIGHLDAAVPWLASVGKPVVYVLGNHERYHEDFLGALAKAKELARGTQVHVLERESVVIQGVRFLGTTLWTDLRALDSGFIHGVWNCMRDYVDIRAEQWVADPKRATKLQQLCKRHQLNMPEPHFKDGKLRLHPGITYLEHAESVRWLKRQLDRSFDGFTVVVTHHAPSHESLRQHGLSDETLQVTRWSMRDPQPAKIAGYASELLAKLHPETRGAIDLWIHGHTHTAMDYVEHGVRVLTNPRGRPYGKLPEGDLAEMHKLGYRFDQQRLDELRQREKEDPYAGDGRYFEPELVVDLLSAYERPFYKALAPRVERMEELCLQLQELLPHTVVDDSVPTRCVHEAFATRIRETEALLEGAQKLVVAPLDRWAGNHLMRTLQTVYPPYLRSPWPGDEPLSRKDFERAAAMADDVLVWMRGAHWLLRRHLLAWGAAARLSLDSLQDAGLPARAAALPVRSLRTCSMTDLHLQLDEPGEKDESGYGRVNEKPASALLERVLNGNTVPRKWIASFFMPEDAAGRLLCAQDLHAFESPTEATC